jgi:hypothetical protein
VTIETFPPDDPRHALLAAPPERIAPGARCYLARQGESLVARLSAEITGEMPSVADRVGIIGHFEAIQAEAGVALLRRARDDLFAAGAGVVIGPMNGSSWARYRLVVADTGRFHHRGALRKPDRFFYGCRRSGQLSE